MSVSLVKGQRVDLTKGNSGLKKVLVGLGWDVNRYSGDSPFDLDVSAFFVDANEKVRSDADFIFYNQTSHASGSIVYSGDNQTGDGDGDDETFVVDLSKVPADVEKIVFAAIIYEGDTRLQNFGMVDNAYIRLCDNETGEELFRCDLTEDASLKTGMVAGKIYRKNGEWKYEATNGMCDGGLEVIARSFGVNL